MALEIEVRLSPGWHPRRQPWQYLVRRRGELVALGFAHSQEAAQKDAETAHRFQWGNQSGRRQTGVRP